MTPLVDWACVEMRRGPRGGWLLRCPGCREWAKALYCCAGGVLVCRECLRARRRRSGSEISDRSLGIPEKGCFGGQAMDGAEG